MTTGMREKERTRGEVERIEALRALSPLDGRYRPMAAELSGFFSEGALIRKRIGVEVEYFLALLEALGQEMPVSDSESLRAWADGLGDADLLAIKDREAELAHDVKAVEYAVRDAVRRTSLARHAALVHAGLTSEDVNNLAYGQMLTGAVRGPIWAAARDVVASLLELARAHRSTPMLGRTHGQPATPTTLGKELGVYLQRLADQLEALGGERLPGKLSGATGTYGAHVAAYPAVEWLRFSRRFVEGLGLRWSPLTTQIEPHDGYAALFDRLRRIGNILLDLCGDLWRYTSDGWLCPRAQNGEVGSSTMPHKVNPIDFENAEGNLGLANALFAHMGDKLQKSRLQRDLSDSTVLRNMGVAFGHLLLAQKAIARGLSRLDVDATAMRRDLSRHPEVLAEAYQTALRAEGHDLAFEALKELTRGREITLDGLRLWLRGVPVSDGVRDRLLQLTPESYVGLAPELADMAIAAAERVLATQPMETQP